ncbi:MAG: hypothetical protein EOO27_47315 [Comamonadaceae bacterium]|nr:MAG: hypothetical protein EOO27_47315 [Comamonadaceae bacterium]
MQGSGTGYAASKSAGGTRTLPPRIGALTGLELPKHRPAYPADPYESRDLPDDLPEGPNVQPMREGLPDTPIDACRELMLAIVARGMIDQDLKYITSPVFIHHLLYVGLDPDAALNVKIAYLQGKVKPGALVDLHRPRRASA